MMLVHGCMGARVSAPFQNHLVRACLLDLMHLEDGCQEVAQEGDVELVPCAPPP